MSAQAKIRVLIVEDHPPFRQGLSMVIGSQPDMLVVAQVGTAQEALLQYCRHAPDITLMDQELPGQTGTGAILAIRKQSSAARVIMLTTSEGDVEIEGAVSAGASAYLPKSTPCKELLSTIRAVHEGRTHLPPTVAFLLATHLSREGLSENEMDILRLLQSGNCNRQIAEHLSLTESTVTVQIRNLLEKLQVKDRAHALSMAIRRGTPDI